MVRIYGKNLAAKWGVQVERALYRKTGDCYHQLEKFPSGLFDADGYIVFDTEVSFRSSPNLRILQDVSVPEGIKKIPGYVQVIRDGKQQPVTSLDQKLTRWLLDFAKKRHIKPP